MSNPKTVHTPMPNRPPPEICPICREGGVFNFVADYLGGSNRYSLYQCAGCQVQFWEPFKNPEAKWYADTYSGEYSIKNLEKPKIVRAAHKKFLSTHRSFPSGTMALDMGCGTGEFLHELERRGCEVWGVDFSRAAVEISIKHFGFKNVFIMSISDFFRRNDLPRFDLITAFDLLEHLEDPLEFIQGVAKLLKPGGTFVINTPSRERTLPNLAGCDFPPHHLTRWNQTALSNLCSKAGFEMTNIQYPGQFRSYLSLFNNAFGTGLVVRAARGMAERGEISQPGPIKIFLLGLLHSAGYVKQYILAGPPAAAIWLYGKIRGRKNGSILAEFILRPKPEP